MRVFGLLSSKTMSGVFEVQSSPAQNSGFLQNWQVSVKAITYLPVQNAGSVRIVNKNDSLISSSIQRQATSLQQQA